MPHNGVESVSRRINAERLAVLSWPRAILLQLAHPLVAAGVAEHSSFRGGAASRPSAGSITRFARCLR